MLFNSSVWSDQTDKVGLNIEMPSAGQANRRGIMSLQFSLKYTRKQETESLLFKDYKAVWSG